MIRLKKSHIFDFRKANFFLKGVYFCVRVSKEQISLIYLLFHIYIY